MKRDFRFLLLVTLALPACASGPRPNSQSAVRFMLGKEQVFDIRVDPRSLTIGGRGLEHTPNTLSGIMGKRVTFRADNAREMHRQGLWRLKRTGGRLEGIVEGQEALFTVKEAGQVLTIQGNVGIAGVAIVLTPEALSMAVQEMKYDFKRDPKLNKPGLRVFVARDGRLRLSLSLDALKKTRASLDAALLMTAIELWAENRRAAFNNRPGWMDAPPEHFQRRQ